MSEKSKIKEILIDIMQSSRDSIADAIVREGANASGRTIKSLRSEVTEGDDGMSARLFGRQAFHTLERGRAGGRVPRGFRHIIRQWMMDKGIDFGNEPRNRSFAYFVASKIALEGTKLYREGGRTSIYSPAIDTARQRLEDAKPKIFRILTESIKDKKTT